MAETEDPAPFSLLALLGLKPFGVKAAIGLYLVLCCLWFGALAVAKGSDLFATRPMTQDEINAARWQKSSDPAQLGKPHSPPPSSQSMGINDLFRPQPSGINPFDATRHAQTAPPPLIADWPARIETMALMGSPPAFGLLFVIFFARHIRRKEQAEADAKAAEKTREEEERHRARRRGKGIPMRRMR